jgi:hypothetical protein
MIRKSFFDTAIALVEYRQTFTGPESRDWFNLMRDFDGHVATNPRDHVYGLLGLANAEYAAKIVPDYEADVSQVYTQSMQAMLDEHRGDLRPRTRHVFNTGRIGLPSWVPDFGAHSVHSPGERMFDRHGTTATMLPWITTPVLHTAAIENCV